MSHRNWAVRALLAALGVAGGLAVSVVLWWSTPHVYTYLLSLAILSAFLWLMARVATPAQRRHKTPAGTNPALTPFPPALTSPAEMPAGWCWQCGRRVKPTKHICYGCGATQVQRRQREQSAAEPRQDRPAAVPMPTARWSAASAPSSAGASSYSPSHAPSASPVPASSPDWSTRAAQPRAPSPLRSAPMHQPGVPPPWLMPRVPPSPQGRPEREKGQRPSRSS